MWAPFLARCSNKVKPRGVKAPCEVIFVSEYHIRLMQGLRNFTVRTTVRAWRSRSLVVRFPCEYA